MRVLIGRLNESINVLVKKEDMFRKRFDEYNKIFCYAKCKFVMKIFIFSEIHLKAVD